MASGSITKSTKTLRHATGSVSVSTAWGSVYSGSVDVNISSLNLSDPTKIIGVSFVANDQWSAFPMIGGITNTNVTVTLLRGSAHAVTGNIYLTFEV